VPVRSFLIVSDAAAPLVAGEAPVAATGLARALAARGAEAVIVSLAPPEVVAAVPGLARRLRTLRVRIGEETRDLALFEGKAPLAEAQLLVAGAVGQHRGESAALLAGAVRALAEDGLLKPDVAIAWGETAAPALSGAAASVRVFAVPSGRLGDLLSPGESRALGAEAYGDGFAGRSLAAIGAAAANAIVAPSAAAARLLEKDPGVASRASDEPIFTVRLGCDDPPNDPSNDAALPAHYAPQALAGKLECRRVVTRRHSLAVGPRTLLLASAPLRHGKGGDELLAALPALAQLDVALLLPAEGDADLLDRARRVAIQSPGRVAVVDAGESQDRLLRAAADAVLCADPDDRTARAPALAQRYGALPLAFDGGAPRDHLIDYDPASATGSAILFDALDPHHIEGAVRRALALRASADQWAPLVQRLMQCAPRWSQTASAFEEIAAAFA
jgi:hypothetical protein